VVLGAFLDGRQRAARAVNQVDPITATVRNVVGGPALAGGESAGFLQDLFEGGRLRRENEALRAQINAAELYSETVDRLNREIDQLRRLQGLPSTPGQRAVSADIVGFFPSDNRITLSRGRSSGIRPGMPVIAADGLVGVVQTVEDSRSQALLLHSAALKIGAMDASRNPSPTGLLQGVDSSTVSFTLFDPKAPIEVGDLIVTSGFGERIPRGLVIGRVIQVEDIAELGTRRAMVDPAVNLGLIREVKVLQ